ncbi:MAG: stage V sporulation T C-terminal domain-containing protein [Bacilli bacterium]|nr:stage V sporulation T C-terminal domain-containing protein [Bacilli bacterium]
MKATGVIRRIDELGRIVVPKEIRKNLRIREGDSLEIFVGENENIILKKHSALHNIKDFASLLVEAVYKDIKRNILITDTDEVLACAGKGKKEYLGKPISTALAESINRRDTMLERHTKLYQICDKEEEMTYSISTIIAEGNAVGCVLIFDKEESVGETEKVISSVVANFLANHIEQ